MNCYVLRMLQLIAAATAVASNIQWQWIDNNLAAGICGALLAWFAERLYRRIKEGSVEPWNEGLRRCHEQRQLDNLMRDLKRVNADKPQ